jgi:glucans biosynthesis protein
MRRRDLLAAAPAMALTGAFAQAAEPQPGFRLARDQARALAARPYRRPVRPLPRTFADLGYDAYRDIRYRPDKALWRDLGLPFEIQMFHRGGLYQDPVDLYEVVEGRAAPLAYSSDLFDFGRTGRQALPPDTGYAGFRIHAPYIAPPRVDELAVFLGASYFRAVSRDTLYGLSARALAIGAGEPNEEFPAFRSFYIERPARSAQALVVNGVVDSPSVAAAYRFRITPGAVTRFDVQASLFPRRALRTAGVAPLTSMFLFGPGEIRRFDDFRPEVHDSDGLLIMNGAGERIWRPLANPSTIQTSAFLDRGPRGFGLMQRQRAFAAYHDLEASYEKRPSAWIEPMAGFGAGDVRLVELPARSEAEDNIVTSWRPAAPLTARREHRFDYRLNWGADPSPPSPLARAIQWRSGHGSEGRRRFVIDFAPFPSSSAGSLRAEVSATKGAIRLATVQPNSAFDGVRLSFELDPGGAAASELRAVLFQGARPVSEVWISRWFA